MSDRSNERPRRNHGSSSSKGRNGRPGNGGRKGRCDDSRDRRNDRSGDGRGRSRNARPGGDEERKFNNRHNRSQPRRQGYREDRMAQKLSEPDLPSDLDISVLDPSVLQDLKVLSHDNATRVAKHMIMAADLLDDDPALALRHARAAKNRAGRVGVVRETNGVIAYHAGEWKEALSELRAARRMSGGPGLLAVMADAERGLGRPEKALELGRSPEARDLDREGRIELAIVLSGARRDLGQVDSAIATLERVRPNKDERDVSAMRLSYAYADALLAAGRKAEAADWFKHVIELDPEMLTDAKQRLEETE
ncbi:hypothetical protein JMN37_09530 [Corynebacterium sp. MC-18]|uniref:Tetratricopeptide repeat protein n=2 Tax=Corynebacteriaceae TaxID=1653 RepID=A0AAW5HXX9_9CORY|nr:hypothetical protein [Corynebacterium lipophilum]